MTAPASGCTADEHVLPHSSSCEAAKRTAAQNGGCTCGQPWKGHPQPHTAVCWLIAKPSAS